MKKHWTTVVLARAKAVRERLRIMKARHGTAVSIDTMLQMADDVISLHKYANMRKTSCPHHGEDCDRFKT